MKKRFLLIAAGVSLFVIACNESSKPPVADKNENSNQPQTQKNTDAYDSSVHQVKIRLFKHSGLDFDTDGVCVNGSMADKEKITEVKSVENGTSVKCSEGEYIQKVMLEGKANELDFVFSDKNGKELYRKEKFKLENSVSFSAVNHVSDESGMNKEKKGADFADWVEKAAKVQILYKGQLIKEVSWKNNGWFRQAGGE